MFQFKDMEQFVKEEEINLGQLCQFFDCIATTDSFRKVEETVVLRFDNFFHQSIVCYFGKFRHFIVVNPDFKRTTSFQKRLFNVPTNGHHFTSRFHLSTKTTFPMFKLIKRETRNLSNHVVKSWFEHGIGCTSDRVNHLVQCQTDSDFSSQFGNWVTCCF